MGALVTKALRPIKSFNIENRAHRVISKEKPAAAPMYPSSVEDLKRTLEADPNIDEKLDKKDAELDNRLRDVYVTSYGRPEDDITEELKQRRSETKPLPQDRKMVEDFDFGFKEPEKLKFGSTTLRNAVNFISAHQMNPAEVTAAKIAFEYKLKESDVENILHHFKTYQVYIPDKKKTPAIIAGPPGMRKELPDVETKAIDGKTSSEETNLDKDSGKVKGVS